MNSIGGHDKKYKEFWHENKGDRTQGEQNRSNETED